MDLCLGAACNRSRATEVSYVCGSRSWAREGRNENTAVLTGRQAGTGLCQSQDRRAMVQAENNKGGGVFARGSDCNRVGLSGLRNKKTGIRGDPHRSQGIPGRALS